MSQSAKQLITIILVVLLVASFGVVGITFIQNKKIVGEKASLSNQLDGYRSREASQLTDFSNLQQKYNVVEKEKNDLIAKINSVGGNLDDLGAKIKEVARERDDLKSRFTTLQKERDDLVGKLEEKSKVALQVETSGEKSVEAVVNDLQEQKVGVDD